MDSGISPKSPVSASVSSSRSWSLPIHVGNLPLIPWLPVKDSLCSDFMPTHGSGILPVNLFLTSRPASPRYSTSSDFILPISFGSDPWKPLALRSRCLKLVNRPNFLLNLPVMRFDDSASVCSLVMEKSSSGISPEKRLSDMSRYSNSSSFASAVRLNSPQHATLFKFRFSCVTRPPVHTTPCQLLAHGSPTPQLRCTLHRTPLHSS
mmetsp:Transcript_8433/g.38372  ORF Transcript_8433/g.38372 Transcript_8433/m.38372 type:complete len:207 (+) Transcript_8433:2616-3236(+)